MRLSCRHINLYLKQTPVDLPIEGTSAMSYCLIGIESKCQCLWGQHLSGTPLNTRGKIAILAKVDTAYRILHVYSVKLTDGAGTAVDDTITRSG